MMIVCPSCGTSYDLEPASPLPGRRPVRCLRCRTVWDAETPCHKPAVGDNAQCNAKPATTAADHIVHLNRAERKRIADLDAFERIREQAHVAFNAIRSGCREDHNRIISHLGATDVIPPTRADKLLATALAPESSLADAMLGPDTRVSPVFAEAPSEAVGETAWPNDRANELFYDQQPANSGLFVVAAGDEQAAERRLLAVTADAEQPTNVRLFAATADGEPPAEGPSFAVAADDERRAADGSVSVAGDDEEPAEDGSIAVEADGQDFASVAARDESPADAPNESSKAEAPPIAPVDLNESRLPIGIDENPTQYSNEPREKIQPFAERRHRGRARHWSPPRWPMSRLQTGILALFAIDCILVGWRCEVVHALPQTASFYKLVGLPVNLRGLDFDGVTATTEQHEGVPVLVVEGNIVNGAGKMRDLPRLKFIVRNAARQEIYSSTAVAPRKSLPPGEVVSFRTELASPPPDGHDVLFRFVDRRDIIAAAR
jgi:predicted Zn finger-like uncharacterized protein